MIVFCLILGIHDEQISEDCVLVWVFGVSGNGFNCAECVVLAVACIVNNTAESSRCVVYSVRFIYLLLARVHIITEMVFFLLSNVIGG